jgi:hypothetical protein
MTDDPFDGIDSTLERKLSPEEVLLEELLREASEEYRRTHKKELACEQKQVDEAMRQHREMPRWEPS